MQNRFSKYEEKNTGTNLDKGYWGYSLHKRTMTLKIPSTLKVTNSTVWLSSPHLDDRYSTRQSRASGAFRHAH